MGYLQTKTILSNLLIGIECDFVLTSHIELCRNLKFSGANEFILEQIQQNKFRRYDQVYAIKIYVELDGEKEKLLPYFESLGDFNSDVYLELAQILHEEYPIEIEQALVSSLTSASVSAEKKNEIAHFLTKTGSESGLSFLINFMKNTMGISKDFRVPFLKKIKTEYVLKEFSKIMSYFLEENTADHSLINRQYSIKNFMLDGLYQLAIRSEKDLELVEGFLNTAQLQLEKINPDSKDVLFHTNRIIEKFRENENNDYGIAETKSILDLIVQ